MTVQKTVIAVTNRLLKANLEKGTDELPKAISRPWKLSKVGPPYQKPGREIKQLVHGLERCAYHIDQRQCREHHQRDYKNIHEGPGRTDFP